MFAAMNLAGKTDAEQAIREFRGDAGNVAAYLMTEVLDAQPPELREFLLRTCIVDEVRPGLAEALTGRACDLRSLEFLSHGNSFIQPVPGTADCYSYQPLFREFLRAQLLFERPTARPRRCTAPPPPGSPRTVSRWRRSTTPSRPVTGGDAARYLVEDLDFAGLLVGRRRRQLTTLFAGLPDDLDGAEAAVVRAARALGRVRRRPLYVGAPQGQGLAGPPGPRPDAGGRAGDHACCRRSARASGRTSRPGWTPS